MNAPIRDKTMLGTLTSLIAGGVAVLAYLLRVCARLPLFGGNWGLDDWAITLAIVIPLKIFSVSRLTVCRYSSSRSRFAHTSVSGSRSGFLKLSLKLSVNQYGFGKDMWFVPFDNITKVLEVRSCSQEL